MTVPQNGGLTVTSTLTTTGELAGPGTVTLPSGATRTLGRNTFLSGVTLARDGTLTLTSDNCGDSEFANGARLPS